MIRGEQVPERLILPTRLLGRQSCGCPAPSIARAGMAPSVRSQQPFSRQALAEQEHAPSEAVESLGLLPADRESALVGQLLDAFCAEVTGDSSGEFLACLSEGLRQAVFARDDVSAWDDLVSALRQAALSSIADPRCLLRAEHLFHQSRVLIGDTGQRDQAYQTLQARE